MTEAEREALKDGDIIHSVLHQSTCLVYRGYLIEFAMKRLDEIVPDAWHVISKREELKDDNEQNKNEEKHTEHC